MELVQKARAQLMLKHPFFSSLLMSMDAVECTVLPNGQPNLTLATDMQKIYYNKDFCENVLKTPDLVMSAFAHEVLHVAFLNGFRLGSRNPMLWNIATDFANNLVLKDSGFEIGDGWLCDDKFKGWSADQIYEHLQQQLDKAAKKAKGQGKQPQPGDPGTGVPGFDPMHGEGGDLLHPDAQNPAQEAETRRQIQQKVAQATQMARMAGKLSGDLERLVGEILDPKVPWHVLLRDYMTRVTKDNESWMRRNRRFQDFYLPARYSEKMGPIVVIGDTSGSISQDELDMAASEIQAVSDQVKPERIHVLWADTRVAKEQVFEENDLILAKPGGGGGTDMRVPLAHAEKYQPEVVILITDGYTPWPDSEPPYPLIVCCTTDVDCPVGMTIRMR